MAHTPGPWHCHYLGSLATGITTASIDEFNKEGDRGDLIAWVPHDRNEEANAALIAAAPDLLAACQRVISYWNCGPRYIDGVDVDDVVKAAINKAEGRGQ